MKLIQPYILLTLTFHLPCASRVNTLVLSIIQKDFFDGTSHIQLIHQNLLDWLSLSPSKSKNLM